MIYSSYFLKTLICIVDNITVECSADYQNVWFVIYPQKLPLGNTTRNISHIEAKYRAKKIYVVSKEQRFTSHRCKTIFDISKCYTDYFVRSITYTEVLRLLEGKTG